MTDPVMLLSQLHGEGRVTFRAVRAAGFYTLTSIAESSAQSLADRAHLSLRTARRLKTGAEELIGKGVGLEPSEGEAPAARGPAGRASKKGRKRAAAAAEFSDGVSMDEARLLVAESAAEPAAAEEEAGPAGPARPTGRFEPPPAIDLHVASRMAAAAEAAASLSRPAPGSVAAPPPDGAEPRRPGRTFWVFG
jgi:hypothetical protein